jgi:hypothetical protein
MADSLQNIEKQPTEKREVEPTLAKGYLSSNPYLPTPQAIPGRLINMAKLAEFLRDNFGESYLVEVRSQLPPSFNVSGINCRIDST